MLKDLRDRIPDRNVWVVYATIFVLSIAYGLAIALTPIVLEHRGLETDDIGSLASFFGLGLVSCAIPAGALIRRFTARGMLVVCIIGYAVMIGIFPFLPEYWQMSLCRYLDGAFSVGAWVSCETLLLARSDAKNKAFVTSLYAIATGIGYVVGPIAAWLIAGSLTPENTFIVAGIIAFASSLIALFRLDADPPSISAPIDAPAKDGTGANVRRPLELTWAIKMSAIATFMTGFFQSAAVLFLPVYLQEVKHVPERDTLLVVAFAAGGMLVLANPAGRLGDRHGHLFVMRGLAIAGVATLLSFTGMTDYRVMCVALLFGGGALLAMAPISLALQGVIARPEEYTRSNSIFNVFFASGLLLGPLVAGHLMTAVDDEALIYLFAVMWSVFIVASLFFRRDDPRAQGERRAAPSEAAPVEDT